MKGGYDQAFSRFSPGKLLHHAMVERAFERRLSRYEFLGGDEPYKRNWAKQASSAFLLQAFERSLPGAVDWAAFAWGRPLAKKFVATAEHVPVLR